MTHSHQKESTGEEGGGTQVTVHSDPGSARPLPGPGRDDDDAGDVQAWKRKVEERDSGVEVNRKAREKVIEIVGGLEERCKNAKNATVEELKEIVQRLAYCAKAMGTLQEVVNAYHLENDHKIRESVARAHGWLAVVRGELGLEEEEEEESEEGEAGVQHSMLSSSEESWASSQGLREAKGKSAAKQDLGSGSVVRKEESAAQGQVGAAPARAAKAEEMESGMGKSSSGRMMMEEEEEESEAETSSWEQNVWKPKELARAWVEDQQSKWWRVSVWGDAEQSDLGLEIRLHAVDGKEGEVEGRRWFSVQMKDYDGDDAETAQELAESCVVESEFEREGRRVKMVRVQYNQFGPGAGLLVVHGETGKREEVRRRVEGTRKWEKANGFVLRGGRTGWEKKTREDEFGRGIVLQKEVSLSGLGLEKEPSSVVVTLRGDGTQARFSRGVSSDVEGGVVVVEIWIGEMETRVADVVDAGYAEAHGWAVDVVVFE